MGLITRSHTFVHGEIPTASEFNVDIATLFTLVNGQLDKANVDSSSSDGIKTLDEDQTLTGDNTYSGSTIFNGAVVFNEQGSSTDYRFETNNIEYALFVDGSADKIGIGLSAPASLVHIHIDGSDPDDHARIQFTNDASGKLETDGFTIGYDADDFVRLQNQDATHMYFTNVSTTADFIFWANSEADKLLTIEGTGSIVMGAGALADAATDGFLYIPTTTSGAPSGVPATRTGRVALVYDNTNEKLYLYNGAWVGITLS